MQVFKVFKDIRRFWGVYPGFRLLGDKCLVLDHGSFSLSYLARKIVPYSD
jgi:hypothetical protein